MDLVGFSRQATQTQMNLSGQSDTVEIVLPAGCPLPTGATGWTRHTDGKITARYTRDELLAALDTIGWLSAGVDQISVQGLGLYARLRMGKWLCDNESDPARLEKFVKHWCQLSADLAIAEPELIGAGQGAAYWRRWVQEVTA